MSVFSTSRTRWNWLSRREPQRVFCRSIDGYGRERQSEGGGAVPGGPLIAIVRANRIAGLPHHDVFGGGVDVAPVHGEALRRTEGAAHLLHRSGVAGLRAGFDAGPTEEGNHAIERVRERDGVPVAVVPPLKRQGGVGVVESLGDGGGEQVVPARVLPRQPCRRFTSDELLFDIGALRPFVELPVAAQFRFEQQWPERVTRGADDGRRGFGGVHHAVPGTEDVRRSTQASGGRGSGVG